MTLAESEASAGSSGPPAAAVLGALPDPVLVVDGNGQVRYANPAAEQFFATGTAVLLAGRLDDLIPADSPLAAVVRQVQESGAGVYEHAAQLSTRRIGPHLLNVQVVPLGDRPRSAVVTLREHSIATKMDRQLNHLGVARSVAGMAAVLAHEVKNPLSGIRGAAQLLEQNAADEDRDLTRLICDETDRICELVDRMELFSDQRPIERGAVNIHEVLEHVRKIGQAGFASRVRFKESYDPSLPPVDGHRDRLVQVFLNLIKNAAEAVADDGGEITIATAYRNGLRLAVPGSADRGHLPLEVSVHDNGAGVPEDIRAHLFEAFVTGKSDGSGLGLSLVAKIVGDHGGVIEWESEPRDTVFRVRLPVLTGANGAA
jgi:two-component system nitrogen regulation sensor histidine kinase GlnL